MGFWKFSAYQFLLWIGRIIGSFGVIVLLFSFSENAEPGAPYVAVGIIIFGILINWFGAYKLR